VEQKRKEEEDKLKAEQKRKEEEEKRKVELKRMAEAEKRMAEEMRWREKEKERMKRRSSRNIRASNLDKNAKTKVQIGKQYGIEATRPLRRTPWPGGRRR